MKRPRLPKLPQFTREAKFVAGAVLSATFLALAVAMVLPIVGLYSAAIRAESTIIDAIAAGEADKIRAAALAESPGAALLLDMKAIEGAGR